MEPMRRRALTALLLFVLVSTPAFGQKTGSQFMWKVEGPNGSSAYLLGSLHILTAEYYPLSATINKAFAESKTLVEEIDIDEMNDPMMMMAALSKAMLADGRTLDQLIAPELYVEVKQSAEKAGLPENVAAESIRTTQLDPTLPLESIKRISKFLSDNGVITRDVSGEIAQHYTYDFLAKATGKSPEQLGLKQ